MTGVLEIGEPHPSARSALSFVRNMPLDEKLLWAEALASCALEGNRVAEICGATLQRVMEGEPVSDRYILGLAWFLITSVDMLPKEGASAETDSEVPGT